MCEREKREKREKSKERERERKKRKERERKGKRERKDEKERKKKGPNQIIMSFYSMSSYRECFIGIIGPNVRAGQPASRQPSQ